MPFRTRRVPGPIAAGLALFSEKIYPRLRPGAEPPLTRYGMGLMSKSQTLDISAARADLKYEPRVALIDGVKEFAKWWQGKAARLS
jgi:nucleoside-diphosphate-sugar epimerase